MIVIIFVHRTCMNLWMNECMCRICQRQLRWRLTPTYPNQWLYISFVNKYHCKWWSCDLVYFNLIISHDNEVIVIVVNVSSFRCGWLRVDWRTIDSTWLGCLVASITWFDSVCSGFRQTESLDKFSGLRFCGWTRWFLSFSGNVNPIIVEIFVIAFEHRAVVFHFISVSELGEYDLIDLFLCAFVASSRW